jgi:DNA-directed RNA polymerase subunit RPC12/RpoP
MINNALTIIKNNFKWKKLLTYMIRWQLSTPILAGVTYIFTGTSESVTSAILGNLVGSLIFYWIDLVTFLSGTLSHQWEVKENITCHDCGKENVRGYRLVIAPKYNRMKHTPQFRCESCSEKKVEALKEAGLSI